VTGVAAARIRAGVIERYRDRLPVTEATPVVTLGEGSTPLVPSERLSVEVGCQVYLKFEGANPTGSFKDRGMTVAISRALEDGARAVVCASTGNTGAAAAAYAARAGLTAAVLVPRGKVAVGKLAQAVIHGARVLEVEGSFDRALEVSVGLAERFPVTLVNSINPHRLQGQKTAAFEICDTLGRAPDVHCIPVGNAGNITSYWMGYSEYLADGVIERAPRMLGFQAEGAAPIVLGRVVAHPETVATAIRVGNPASWKGAVAAAEGSGGAIAAVSDDEILAAYRGLALEGLFVEPASGASVAGLRAAAARKEIEPGSLVVCVLTGHGLKDPDRALATAEVGAVSVPADPDAVAEELGL
jgi:threonine synthase